MTTPIWLRAAQRIAFVSCVLVASPVRAAPPGYTFDDTLNRAADIPAIRALRARAIAASEDAQRAGRLPDPRIVVGLENLPVTGPDAFDPAADDMTMKRVGIMQDLPAPARRHAEQTLANRNVDLAQAAQVERNLEAREAAALAWLDVWAARRAVDVLADGQTNAHNSAQMARARLAGGSGTASDALAMRGAALDLENRVDDARGRLEQAQAALGRALGLPGRVDIAGEPPAFDRLPVPPNVLRTDVDRLRPLATWPAREALADSAIDVATASRHPDWSVGATYGQRSGGRSDMLMVEVSVGLPLRTGNRQDRDIAARRAERDAIAAEHDQARLDTQAQLETRLSQWEALGRQAQRVDSQAIPLARDRVDVAAASYRGGAPLQSWLDARRDLLERLVEANRIRGEYARAWARLAFLADASGGVR